MASDGVNRIEMSWVFAVLGYLLIDGVPHTRLKSYSILILGVDSQGLRLAECVVRIKKLEMSLLRIENQRIIDFR